MSLRCSYLMFGCKLQCGRCCLYFPFDSQKKSRECLHKDRFTVIEKKKNISIGRYRICHLQKHPMTKLETGYQCMIKIPIILA